MIMNDNNFIGIFFYEEMQKKCSRNMSSDLNLPSIENTVHFFRLQYKC